MANPPPMTVASALPRALPIAVRIVARWNALAQRLPPVTAIVAAWAVLVLPLVFFRGYNSDEGLAVSIARAAVEDDQWLVPHFFNSRLIERPTLLSWIIAAVSEPFGQVSQVSARLPVALFLLAGCLLIYGLLRRVGASVPASLLGAALFLACPLVIRSYVTITADMPLAVLLFLAFFLWWSGHQEGAIGTSRWIAVGVVLALAGLLKGPQPIAYFALGVSVFVLGHREWRQIPGLILAGLICALPLAAWYAAVHASGDEAAWAAFMRLRPVSSLPGPLAALFGTLAETLPAALLAAAFLLSFSFRRPSFVRPGLVAALACYAFAAPLVILFWPGGSTARYYLPMVPPLCVLGGLGYDLLSAWRPQIVTPVLVLTASLLAYALGYSALSPFMPAQFRQAWIDAEQMTKLVETAPGPIYRVGDAALNVLPYVPGRILNARSLAELAALSGPAWMVMPTDQADALLARRADKLHSVMRIGEDEQWRLLRLDP